MQKAPKKNVKGEEAKKREAMKRKAQEMDDEIEELVQVQPVAAPSRQQPLPMRLNRTGGSVENTAQGANGGATSPLPPPFLDTNFKKTHLCNKKMATN